MSRRRLILLALAALVLLGLLARTMLARQPVSDEAFLLALVDDLAARAERRDVKALRGWISERYRDEHGHDRQAIGQLLTLQLLRGAVTVYVLAKEVRVHEDRQGAEVQAKLLLTRSPRVKQLTEIIPEAAKALRLTLRFRREERWMIDGAAWSDLRVQEVLR